jgi:hypothetical protein
MMNLRWGVACALVVSGCAAGAPGTSSDAPSTPLSVQVAGRVLDAGMMAFTGASFPPPVDESWFLVSDASVYAEYADGSTSEVVHTTDGQFTLEVAAGATMHLVVQAAGDVVKTFNGNTLVTGTADVADHTAYALDAVGIGPVPYVAQTASDPQGLLGQAAGFVYTLGDDGNAAPNLVASTLAVADPAVVTYAQADVGEQDFNPGSQSPSGLFAVVPSDAQRVTPIDVTATFAGGATASASLPLRAGLSTLLIVSAR